MFLFFDRHVHGRSGALELERAICPLREQECIFFRRLFLTDDCKKQPPQTPKQPTVLLYYISFFLPVLISIILRLRLFVIRT